MQTLNEKLINSSIEKTLAPILGFETQSEVNEFLKTLEMPLGDYTVLGTFLDDHPYEPVLRNLERVRKDTLEFIKEELKRYYLSFKEQIDLAKQEVLRASVQEGRLNILNLAEAERMDLMSKVPGLQEAYDFAMSLGINELNEAVGPGSLKDQRMKAMTEFKKLSKAAKGGRDLNAKAMAANRAAFGRAGAIPDKKKAQDKTIARKSVSFSKDE